MTESHIDRLRGTPKLQRGRGREKTHQGLCELSVCQKRAGPGTPLSQHNYVLGIGWDISIFPSVPAAATVAEHRHKQQQGSTQGILVLAGRRATDVEIRDLCAGSGDFQLGE